MSLQAVKDSATDQNLRQLDQRFPLRSGDLSDSAKNLFLQLATAGARKLSFGTGTATWTAAEASALNEIDHGLGVVPAIIIVASRNWPLSYGVEARTSTKFTVKGGDMRGGALSGTFTFDWIAIG